MIVGGQPGSGKTVFATHVAKRALELGRKVTYIDSDSPTDPQDVSSGLSTAVLELRQVSSNLLTYIPIQASPLLSQQDFRALIWKALDQDHLLVIDEMPRAAAWLDMRQTPPDLWKTLAQQVMKRIKGQKRECRALMTCTTVNDAKVPLLPGPYDNQSLLQMGRTKIYPLLIEYNQKARTYTVQIEKR